MENSSIKSDITECGIVVLRVKNENSSVFRDVCNNVRMGDGGEIGILIGVERLDTGGTNSRPRISAGTELLFGSGWEREGWTFGGCRIYRCVFFVENIADNNPGTVRKVE